MSNLSTNQASILRSIFSAAPDSAVVNLEQALAHEVTRGGPMAEVHSLVAQEASNRRARSLAFMPLLPLCRPAAIGPYPKFPFETLALLWTACKEKEPNAARAVEALGPIRDEDERAYAHSACDAVCRIAAEGLRGGLAEFAGVRTLLDKVPGRAELFIKLLDLAPLARAALMRLPDWMGRLNEERAVAIRIAYNDGVDLSDDGGPRLLDILCAHMPEPWKVLHLISAVMDRPTDRFAASSEIARFGEFYMDDIDRRLGEGRNFDPNGGRAAGVAAAESVHVIALEIAEFETSLDISRDGVWGARIAKQKLALAQLAETRLAQIDKALDQALPLTQVKFGKGVRGFPKLNEDPSPPQLNKAQSYLAFFEQCRASANQAGYGSTRAKAGERMDARLTQYVEDLLELLRGEEVQNPERIRRYLEAAADLVAVAKGEQAAAIIRRRAAA
ncbi:hypothetical protein [Phenylobacterium montanum]|uniref:Uncharacterized protein n=1 Tax=Phenylobacterium montanum TaxID=2823693 RepID=A0A975FW95_9CAUL|nr:hypothetical protein [Caulobacter sp. S6]QUD86107.1 hypothetical protein KCG34_13455 [Caulobacter sp. S6]